MIFWRTYAHVAYEQLRGREALVSTPYSRIHGVPER